MSKPNLPELTRLIRLSEGTWTLEPLWRIIFCISHLNSFPGGYNVSQYVTRHE